MWCKGCLACQDVTDWQRCLLQVGELFYQDVLQDLNDPGIYAPAEEIMEVLAWRRSALEFLLGLMAGGQDCSEHVGVLEALADKADDF